MVDVVVLPQDQRPPYACHKYVVCLCIKGKWSTLAYKVTKNDRLGGGGGEE